MAALALLLAVCAGCGEKKGLDSDDPDAVVAAWSKIACGGHEVNHITDLAGSGASPQDVEAWVTCSRGGTPGTQTDQFQGLALFHTNAALETFMATKSCQDMLRVTGDRWVAFGTDAHIATEFVQAGGRLCKSK